MGLTLVPSAAALAVVASALGLDPANPIEQFLATSLRRAASLMCPTTPSGLVASVERVLEPVLDIDDLTDNLNETLDAIIAVGDLVETLEEQDGVRRRVIYLGSPRFVRRWSGDAIVFGVRPDGADLVGEDLLQRLDYAGHLRRIPDAPDLHDLLTGEGLREVKAERWLRAPEPCDPADLLGRYNARLAAQGPSGEIPDLRLLDPTSPTTSYRGRWRTAAATDTGLFVARRSQRYGADLWSYVEIANGEPIRLLDLPIAASDRGCDEAWQLQAAIDRCRGLPQQIGVRGTGQGTIRLCINAPPPRWLQRRWDLVGQPARARGALFAYDFATGDVAEELNFAQDRLWLGRVIAPKGND